MKRYRLPFLAFLGVSVPAFALDYKTMADDSVVFDAAAKQATPQFILLKGTPVEVIITQDNWVKIREQSGGMGWVERDKTNGAKNVIVVTQTEIRQQPDAAAPIVFSAAKDVLLEPLEKPSGAWLKVKHRDGQIGYVAVRAVWGI